jgi:hypothetical protein
MKMQRAGSCAQKIWASMSNAYEQPIKANKWAPILSNKSEQPIWATNMSNKCKQRIWATNLRNKKEQQTRATNLNESGQWATNLSA